MNRDAADLAGGWHEKFETLGSTNAEALARARAGVRGPLWISADRQTGGRGRRGNTWISPPGNLYASLLLSEPSPPALAAQLSFVAGLAVCDAIMACTHKPVPVSLKWPNDVLLDRRKIAGLLIEAESLPTFTAVIGIGINCVVHPADTAFPAVDLKSAGILVEPQTLLSRLMTAMTRRLEQWNAGAGFGSIRADWLDRAAGLGQPIKVRLPERQLAGIFRGIDDAGQLLLAADGGTSETIAAGEVFALGR
jgi:BirA family biotin operon repressor/biotin-[acetyl-CoA-carboxylase] ligase